MKELINKCLSSLDLTYRVNVKEVNAMLDYYRVFYRTSDMSYHKIELFYNSSMIFSKNQNKSQLLIGTGIEDFRDKVYNSIEDYDSYEECQKEIKRVITSTSINEMLSKYLESITNAILEVYVEGIEILKVSTFLKPVSCVSVMYSLDGVVRTPLKLFLGENNEVLREDNRENLFIEEINSLVKGGF